MVTPQPLDGVVLREPSELSSRSHRKYATPPSNTPHLTGTPGTRARRTASEAGSVAGIREEQLPADHRTLLFLRDLRSRRDDLGLAGRYRPYPVREINPKSVCVPVADDRPRLARAPCDPCAGIPDDRPEREARL
jgi:hypothetical protein